MYSLDSPGLRCLPAARSLPGAASSSCVPFVLVPVELVVGVSSEVRRVAGVQRALARADEHLDVQLEVDVGLDRRLFGRARRDEPGGRRAAQLHALQVTGHGRQTRGCDAEVVT